MIDSNYAWRVYNESKSYVRIVLQVCLVEKCVIDKRKKEWESFYLEEELVASNCQSKLSWKRRDENTKIWTDGSLEDLTDEGDDGGSETPTDEPRAG